ncbi:hypothetical protein Tco_0443264 [Tanacetum coccineum]
MPLNRRTRALGLSLLVDLVRTSPTMVNLRLLHTIPVVAPVAPPGQQIPPEDLAAHAAWVKGQKEVANVIITKAMFSNKMTGTSAATVREFHTSCREEGQSVSSHVLKMKGYIDNLERLGQPVGQNLAVSLILVSLNKDFTSFVQNFNMHGMWEEDQVNELHASFKAALEESLCHKKDANPATSMQYEAG